MYIIHSQWGVWTNASEISYIPKNKKWTFIFCNSDSAPPHTRLCLNMYAHDLRWPLPQLSCRVTWSLPQLSCTVTWSLHPAMHNLNSLMRLNSMWTWYILCNVSIYLDPYKGCGLHGHPSWYSYVVHVGGNWQTCEKDGCWQPLKNGSYCEHITL